MEVQIGCFTFSLALDIIKVFADKVVHFDIMLMNDFFFNVFWLLVILTFLFICIFVVNAVVKILIIEFFIIPIKLTYSLVKPDHKILVHHEALRLFKYVICCFVASLSIKRTQNHTSDRVIFQQGVVMGLYTTFGELCVEIIRPSGCLIAGQIVFLFLKFFKFSFLNNIRKFFANKIKLLLIKNVDMLVYIFI